MSYPDVQHLHYNYETLSDLYRPYKLLSNPFNRSMQSLTPSSVGDQREFRRFSNGTIVHMSSHYPLVPDHDSTMYSPATYSASEVELPHHTLYPAPTLVEHQTGPTYNSHHNHHHGGWQSLDSFSVPPDPSLVYGSFPNGTSFPEAPRLTPPPPPTVSAQRLTLSGSLDPTSGIFYRTPEHPRLRTAQACEKCRTRKAKCSGEHPSCQRCLTRGLVCEYAKEGRVRGPNRVKSKSSISSSGDAQSSTLPHSTMMSATSDEPETKSEVLAETTNPTQNPGEKISYSPHSKSSSPRRNPLPAERYRLSRPRPPSLRLDTMSHHYQQDSMPNNEGNEPSSALMSGADMKNLEEGNLHPNGEAATGSHNMITNPPFHNSYADSTPTINASHLQPCDPIINDGHYIREEMDYLRREGIHPQVMNELYHSTVTFPPQNDGQNTQYHHTNDRRSVGSLTYSTASASSVSSPATPLSTSLIGQDINYTNIGGESSDLHFTLNYSDVDVEQQSHQPFGVTWNDANQSHENPTPEMNSRIPTLEKSVWENTLGGNPLEYSTDMC